ncbi:PD-(D/E)XK nuclease family protein [Desulfovibrio sp. OttesenSCG-928-F20]|nr:PD-(D/E)XK nuclease family protein [Desulfovibrio sp. OttesenSCG-928-F20]
MLTITDWKTFFTDFATLYENVPDEPAAALSREQCKAFFYRFGELHTLHKAQGRGVNVIELAGVGQDELRNCSLLAWLLDCSGSHGQGVAFLHCFLDCVRQSNCPEGFPISADISGSYRTTLESSYDEEEQNGKQRSRVDIELDGSAFLLFIEAKILSGEGEGQLARYLRIGNVRAGNRPWGLAFITRSGSQPSEADLCSKVACISWRTLGKRFLRHAKTISETHGSVVIRQICEHFNNM